MQVIDMIKKNKEISPSDHIFQGRLLKVKK